ncbi:MAG: GNAT family N-acetyltransferase [Lentisphaerae bacterium]|nr:GNAT family N-acetyltransferase [Lentisphaerota bacterium]
MTFLMNMREYRNEDLAKVMEIANIAWRPIRQMSREALGDTIADILNPAGDECSKGLQVKAQIESGQWGIAICEHEGEIVGFITYSINGVWGEICNNGALTSTGLKGIGQTMYKFVMEEFRKAGVKVAKVTTGLDWAHAPARRAYERAGFKKHLDSTTYYMELD